MTPEAVEALKKIAQQILELAGDEPAPVEHEDEKLTLRPLVVRPTGVLGQGKVRYWPKPIEVQRMDGSRGMELCWSYALRMTYIKDENGEPLVPPIFRQQIGEWMQKVAPDPEQWRAYGEAVDRWVYPEDWYDQAEIDKRMASDAQWLEQYNKKYGAQ